MVDYQTIGMLIAAASLVVGVINSILTSRRAQNTKERELETRKTEIYMQLIRQTRTPEFMKQWSAVMDMEFTGRSDWNDKYGSSANPEAFSAYMTVLQTYNSIAQLVKKGILDIETLFDLIMPVAFQLAWAKAKPQITEWSEEEGYHPWETLDWLVGELDKYLDSKKTEFSKKNKKPELTIRLNY